MKTGFIVAYDIGNTKVRTRVFETLKDFGLKHVQESVFWGMLRVADKNAVKRLLTEACQAESDRALMWPMSPMDLDRATIVNYPQTSFEIEEYIVC